MSVIASRTRNKNLKFVDNLADFQVHHNDVDIRDFKVLSTTGEVVGEVEGLLADVPSRLVRYVEIEVDDDILERYNGSLYNAEDRHILVPIGLVDINTSDNTIGIHGIAFEKFIDYPRYNRKFGYTTNYEVDTNDYIAAFHTLGSTYDRNRFSTDIFRNSDSLDNDFYGTSFYTRK